MSNLSPANRLIFALIGGVVTFGLLAVFHIHFWAAVVFGVLVFIALLFLLPYVFATHTAGSAGAGSPMSQSAASVPSKTMSVNSAVTETAGMNGTSTAAPLMTAPAASSAKAAPVAKAEKAAPAAKTEKAAPAAKAASATKAAPAAKAAKAAPTAKSVPAAKSAAKDDAPAAGSVGTAPETLAAPRGGKADDLKVIEGVGPALEKLVNSLGFYHYDQIANWTDAEVAWVDSHMKTFRGRIVRDKWQAQAKLILSEGIAAFLERAKTNNY